MKRRLLLIPIVWLGFGIGEVLALRSLFGGIASVTPTIANDKPIGGSVLPVLFFNFVIILGAIVVSLYALGVWQVTLSSRKAKMDVLALGVLLSGGFMLWYNPLALFPTVASLLYFLAVNLE